MGLVVCQGPVAVVYSYGFLSEHTVYQIYHAVGEYDIHFHPSVLSLLFAPVACIGS